MSGVHNVQCQCLITACVNLDLLVRMLSPWKVTTFPFVSNKYLGGDTLRLSKYPVPSQIFTH